MKRHMAMALLPVALLAGCANPFLGNVFEKAGWGQQPLPNLNSGQDIVNALNRSDSFVDTLTDQQAQQAIESLEDVIDGAVNTPVEQQAALAVAEIAAASSGADDVVQSANNLVTNLVADPSSLDVSNPLEIVSDLFDSDAPPASVREQVEGLLTTAGALNQYGTSLGGTDPMDPPSGTNSGDLASTALVSGFVSVLAQEHPDYPADPTTTPIPDSVFDDIVEVLQDPTTADNPYVDGTAPLPMSTDPDADVTDHLNALFAGSPGITNVVDSGLDLSSLAGLFGAGG
ncbi:MAG: hypothetical protein MI717_03960 [Spirochaetales bacterium]|nr:hypothetical protein [Spirochaetales bacterium]